MMKLFTTLSLSILGAAAMAQTNPAAFNLASGNYVLNNWPATSPAGSYPASMVFHVYDVEATNPEADTPITGDWVCAYNLESRARIIGYGTDGFAFLNTGSYQDTEDRCQGGTGALGSYVGAATLGLNTTGMEAVNVSYLATKMTDGDGMPLPREYRVRAEYRIGATGDFTAIESTIVSSASTMINDPQNVAFSLPEATTNQPEVYLRLRYYQEAQNGGGQRPQWRIGNLNVSGDLVSNTNAVNPKSPMRAFPNPSNDGIFKLNHTVTATLFDITGKAVMEFSNAGEINLVHLKAGVYLLKSNEGEVIRLIRN